MAQEAEDIKRGVCSQSPPPPRRPEQGEHSMFMTATEGADTSIAVEHTNVRAT
jgi:hypothetical protein